MRKYIIKSVRFLIINLGIRALILSTDDRNSYRAGIQSVREYRVHISTAARGESKSSQ